MSGAPIPQNRERQGAFRRSQATQPGRSADTADYSLNHQDTIPHIAPGEHEAQRQASNRAWAALMLATTPEGWAALLRGETLPRDQIDADEIHRIKRRMGAT